MFSRQSFRVLALVAGTCVGSALAPAAEVEVAGFGGGAAYFQGGGTHPIAGGSAAFKIADGLRVFGEFSYSPLGSTTFDTTASGVNVTGSVSEKFYNYGGGVDYSIGHSDRVVPYMLVAIGGGRLSAGGTGTGTVGTTTVTASAGSASNGVTFGVGGGVRFYAGKNWGFKPEFRFERFSSSLGSQNEVNFTGGIFYQFGK